jgi:hypothetical protein
MSKRHEATEATEPEGPPPLFGTWGRFYAFVVANTLLVFALLVLFSVATR